MGFRVAVVGATGNVGREMLSTLAERNFPADDVVALASSRSAGREVSFGEDDILRVQALDTFDFKGIDIVLSSHLLEEVERVCDHAVILAGGEVAAAGFDSDATWRGRRWRLRTRPCPRWTTCTHRRHYRFGEE